MCTVYGLHGEAESYRARSPELLKHTPGGLGSCEDGFKIMQQPWWDHSAL